MTNWPYDPDAVAGYLDEELEMEDLAAGRELLGGYCSFCQEVDGDGPEVQVIDCQRCYCPCAVLRAHVSAYSASYELRRSVVETLYGEMLRHGRPGYLDTEVMYGDPTDHYAVHWRSIHSFARTGAIPKEVSDAVTRAAQDAVRWFHDKGAVFLGDPTVREIPDSEVRERIVGFQWAMDKEVARNHQTLMKLQNLLRETGSLERAIDVWVRLYYRPFVEGPDYEEQEVVHRAYGVDGRPDHYESRYHGKVLRYDLRELPRERQAALVQRWERIWRDYEERHPEVELVRGWGFLPKPYILPSNEGGNPYYPEGAEDWDPRETVYSD